MNRLHALITAILFILPLTLLTANESGPGISADAALKKLKSGNARFMNDIPARAGIDRARREETAKGQKPYVTILGCSDSREALEHIFDAGIGELFVVRVAGNVADTDELGSMEYGVDHLGTPVLLVLGHTKCGAVTAVATGAEVHGHIPALVDNIVPAVYAAKRALGANPEKEALVEKAIIENVNQSIADILSKSPIIAKRAQDGKVMVIGAIYHLDTGAIDWLGAHPEQNALIKQGLASDTGHGGHGTGAWITLAIAAGMIIAICGIFFLCFIAEKRLFTGMKFKARLIMSFVAIILSLAAAFFYSFQIHHLGSRAWGAALALFGITIAAAVLFTVAHLTSFKKFFDEQMAKAKGGGSPE